MEQLENQTKKMKLVIVSNRLPFTIETKEGKTSIHPSSGGLVTALLPVLRDRGGLWIGSIGSTEADTDLMKSLHKETKEKYGFRFAPVFLSEQELDLYYHGCSNEVLWPLFHDLVSYCNFDPRYWEAYRQVNQKFAEEIDSHTDVNDFVWVHDYHLLLVGEELRKKNFRGKIGFFLHTPFPPVDMFVKLPWRRHLIQALLEYDLVGFQTVRDRRNFIQCVKMLMQGVSIQSYKSFQTCKRGDFETRVGTFPISIDFGEFEKKAASEEVSQSAWLLHEKWPNQKLIFCLDRLDYTKGIPYRLEAIRTFLKRYPEFHRNICFVQVIVPSRVEIPGYQTLKHEIDRLVGEINSQFTQENWVPIHYIFRPLPSVELLSYYRTSEVMLVTSVKDGMNLVAKEYVACQIDGRGVLVLSEFAGASAQLHEGVLLINPYDIEGIANALYTALTMPDDEQARLIRLLRRNVKRYDIFWWVQSFLNIGVSKDLKDFPLFLEELVTPDLPIQ